eukprot:TRINITY_DN1210_c0_g5_i1.p1 TRINITY_DN1210_c0_g5~~TRINITY_DN1210_c0_g5_i1.p1  ORF type:complete len:209 (+),score=83.57 TRINITY_DN1210_c0_g5_i1:306-932(+)
MELMRNYRKENYFQGRVKKKEGEEREGEGEKKEGEGEEAKEGEKEKEKEKEMDSFIRPSYLKELWSVFFLWREGKKEEQNCSLCPRTTEIVSQLPDLLENMEQGYVYFSIIEPGGHVRPHFGPSNLRLRLHLGLSLPPGEENKKCWVRVEQEKRSWEEGKVIVFDDSFDHEVHNQSSFPRVVLIVDVWHPDLTHIEIEEIKKFLSKFH